MTIRYEEYKAPAMAGALYAYELRRRSSGHSPRVGPCLRLSVAV